MKTLSELDILLSLSKSYSIDQTECIDPIQMAQYFEGSMDPQEWIPL